LASNVQSEGACTRKRSHTTRSDSVTHTGSEGTHLGPALALFALLTVGSRIGRNESHDPRGISLHEQEPRTPDEPTHLRSPDSDHSRSFFVWPKPRIPLGFKPVGENFDDELLPCGREVQLALRRASDPDAAPGYIRGRDVHCELAIGIAAKGVVSARRHTTGHRGALSILAPPGGGLHRTRDAVALFLAMRKREVSERQGQRRVPQSGQRRRCNLIHEVEEDSQLRPNGTRGTGNVHLQGVPIRKDLHGPPTRVR